MKKRKNMKVWMATFTVAYIALLFVAVEDQTEYEKADRSYRIESVQETIEGNEEEDNLESMMDGKESISIEEEEETPKAASPKGGWATPQTQFIIIGLGILMTGVGTYLFIIKNQTQ